MDFEDLKFLWLHRSHPLPFFASDYYYCCADSQFRFRFTFNLYKKNLHIPSGFSNRLLGLFDICSEFLIQFPEVLLKPNLYQHIWKLNLKPECPQSIFFYLFHAEIYYETNP